jgi:cob(I)alamin adenosyltransferase
MVKIYTKTGDSGTSSLYNGTRLPKSDTIFDCLGDLDELNSHLGLVKGYYNQIKSSNEIYNAPGAGGLFYKTEKCLDTGKYYEWFIIDKLITGIQCKIMDICTVVATPGKESDFSNDYLEIEKLIDRFDSILPPIKNFVVPSGNVLVSQVHVCRVLTRKCERKIVSIENNDSLKIYLNRLSDLFFMLGRFIVMTLGIEEDLYSQKKGLFN